MLLSDEQEKETSKQNIKKVASVIESTHPKLSDDLNDFVDAIEKGEIPRKFPNVEDVGDALDNCGQQTDEKCQSFLLPIFIKQFANANGMYQMVTQTVAKELAQNLKGKKVLEIMAGSGWQAKALAEEGIEMTATDDNSWQLGGRKVFDVENIDGLTAVQHYKDNHDVLLVSWPPYEEDAINEVVKQWGSQKPIIYMGEGKGGCCANDEFFEMLDMDRVETNYQSINFINDDIFQGHLRPEYDPDFKPVSKNKRKNKP